MSSKGPVRYNALIVDNEMSTKMRLKQATASVVQFGKVQLLGSTSEALSKVQSSVSPIDIMFISHGFDQEDVIDLIKDCKEAQAAQDCAFILVLQTSEQDSTNVAQKVMIGADGLLFEPYSVDQLVEITELAAKVKADRSKGREEAAIRFLLQDIMRQIDLIAYLRSCGYDVGRGLRKFKQMCGVLDTLSPQSREIYYRVAADMFEKAPFPKNIYEKSYAGASKRVKERMEKKLLAEIEADLDDGTTAS